MGRTPEVKEKKANKNQKQIQILVGTIISSSRAFPESQDDFGEDQTEAGNRKETT